MISDIRNDIQEIKSGQQKVIWWVAGLVSSFLVGGGLGLLFRN